MFEASNTCTRVYGTYQVCRSIRNTSNAHVIECLLHLHLQWRVDLSDEIFWSSPGYVTGKHVTSPDFRLCSHLWYAFFFLQQVYPNCFCHIVFTPGRKLKIYPRGYQEDEPAHFAASLTCIGTPPNEKVTYQLWLQNHKDPAKTAARGTDLFLLCVSLSRAVLK